MANGELRVRTDGHGSNGNFQLPALSRTYGRFEIRARMDPGGGGPAILLWPTANNWPSGGEIDIMETGGRPDMVYFNNHWLANGSVASKYASVALDNTVWHDYVLEWEPGSIKAFIDGRQVFSQTGTPGVEIPNKPMLMAMQTDGPNSWIAPSPASAPADMYLHIDSVRIYQR